MQQLLQNQPKESTGVMGNLGDAARNEGKAVGDVGDAGDRRFFQVILGGTVLWRNRFCCANM